MFRHNGKRRSYIHNLRLASVLSFVAGIVNITGLLALNILTTNITGHFAYISDAFSKLDTKNILVNLVFIICFLLGAFFSNFASEILSRKKNYLSYVFPITLEIILLTSVAVFFKSSTNLNIWAGILLFSMGLQNALVTKVSQSVVRTTHLTGLFTDLGIELSQLFFYKSIQEKIRLHKSIVLKLTIILCFFLGGLCGGLLYSIVGLKTLLMAGFILLCALFYDYILLKYYHLKRHII